MPLELKRFLTVDNPNYGEHAGQQQRHAGAL
jgi:hypothetical protein